MAYQKLLFKIFGIGGTVAVWAPTTLMLIFSLVGFLSSGTFHMDFLLPAELFLIELVGMLLLVFSAWKEGHYFCPLLGLSIGSIASMATIVIFAEATGMANGTVNPLPWMLVVFYIFTALMSLGFIGVGFFGLKFTLHVFGKAK